MGLFTKNILILALILFASCEETYFYRQNIDMTISDALPVQFWLPDCDTFNEADICGIHSFCFCQPWNCDDELQFQLTHTDETEYTLQVLDEDDNELFSAAMTQTDNYIPPVAAVPGVESGITLPAMNTLVNTVIISTSHGGGPISGTDWTEDANPDVELSGVGSKRSDAITGAYTFLNGYTYKITPSLDYAFDAGNFGTSCKIFFVVLNSSNNIVHSESFTFSPGDSGEFTTELEFVAGADYVKFGFYVSSLSVGSITDNFDLNSWTGTETTPGTPEIPETLATYYLNKTSFIPFDEGICNQRIKINILDDGSPQLVVAKSDCLDVRTSHACTKLIEYSNTRNFAGLIYDEDLSPDETYTIRVPATFFHERFPEDDETIELTDMVVNLNSSMKRQKRLDFDYMPYYMHNKIKLILKHQQLTIDDKDWVKQEEYEMSDSENKRFPIRMSSVWLTDKNYIQRNVL